MFMPAAKVSAHTPLGPKTFPDFESMSISVVFTMAHSEVNMWQIMGWMGGRLKIRAVIG
jgi:hypothetical protein